MPNPIDVPSVITLMKISQYLWSNDKSKANIFQRGSINRNTPTLCRIVRSAIEAAYAADPNDATLFVTCDYGITLIHPRAQLVVNGAACVSPVFVTNPISQTITDGGDVTFTSSAVGTGTISYQWQYNLVNLTDGGSVSGATTASLTITGADTGDAGNYRVIATNACGSAISSTAVLTVNAAALTFRIGWTLVDPYVDNSTPLTISNAQDISFASGDDLVYSGSLTNFANKYVEWRWLATEPTPVEWFNTNLNGGPIPDFSIRDVWTVGAYKYCCARNPLVLDTGVGATLELRH